MIRIRRIINRDQRDHFAGYTRWWYASDGTRHGMDRGRGRAVQDLRKRYSPRERLHYTRNMHATLRSSGVHINLARP